MKKIFIIISLFLSCVSSAWGVIEIVSAENTYAQVAQQIGGQYVHVTSLISMVNQDPHLFVAGPAEAKALANANVVIYNGAGYDAWMDNLLQGSQKPSRIILKVADESPGAAMNPHVWYDPQIIPLYAKKLTTILSQQDSSHALYFNQQLKLFLQNYQQLTQKVADMKRRHHGKVVLLTEPLFEPMADQLDLIVLGQGFAKNSMNESSPTPTDIISFEQAIKHHSANVLIYNVQMISPIVEQMRAKARDNDLPEVGISEIQPMSQDYVTWMLAQLKLIDEALSEKSTAHK